MSTKKGALEVGLSNIHIVTPKGEEKEICPICGVEPDESHEHSIQTVIGFTAVQKLIEHTKRYGNDWDLSNALLLKWMLQRSSGHPMTDEEMYDDYVSNAGDKYLEGFSILCSIDRFERRYGKIENSD